MLTSSKRCLCLAFAAFTAVLASSEPALAGGPAIEIESQGDHRIARVSYRDLDLRSEAGVEALESRVRSAAKEVCGLRPARSITEQIAGRSCFKQSLSRAMTRVQVAVLQARGAEQLASAQSPR